MIYKIANYIFISVVFMISKKLTKDMIDSSQNKKIGYSVYEQNFDLWEALMPALFIALLLYALYEFLLRVPKIKNTVIASVLTGGIPFVAIGTYFTIYSGNRNLPHLSLGVLPFLLAGLILPFSEKGLKFLLKRFNQL